MANLISSKQISGVVTASVIAGDFEVSGSSHITGSFNVSGSISASSTITANNFVGSGTTLSGLELSGRGIVSESIQILGGSGIVSGAAQLELDFLDTLGDGVFTSSAQVTYDNISGIPAFIGGTNVIISSGSGGITINSTGGGGGGGSTDITHLNTYTGSTNVRLTNVESTTSSLEQRVGEIESNTGSYEGGGSSAGTISGSKQITDLGFISSSDSTTSLNTYTASNDINITNIHSTTASLAQRVGSIESVSGSYISNSATSSMTVNSASIAEYTSEWNLTADGSSHYVFQGPGFTGSASDPNIYLVRGQKYKFTNSMGAHPFRIQTTANGSAGTQYNNGVTNNDVSNGTLIFDVPMEAPDVLYYQCTAHGNMGGAIFVSHVSGSSGGSTDISSLNTYTSSNDINITNIHSTTASLNQRVGSIESVSGSYLTSLDSGIVSGAGQILSLIHI